MNRKLEKRAEIRAARKEREDHEELTDPAAGVESFTTLDGVDVDADGNPLESGVETPEAENESPITPDGSEVAETPETPAAEEPVLVFIDDVPASTNPTPGR